LQDESQREIIHFLLRSMSEPERIIRKQLAHKTTDPLAE